MFADLNGAYRKQSKGRIVLQFLLLQERALLAIDDRLANAGSGYPNFAGQCAEEMMVP